MALRLLGQNCKL